MTSFIGKWLQKRRHEKRVRRLRKTQYRLADMKAKQQALKASHLNLYRHVEYVELAGKIAVAEAMIKDMHHDLMEQL